VCPSALVSSSKSRVFQPAFSPPAPAWRSRKPTILRAAPRSTVSVWSPAPPAHHLLFQRELPSSALAAPSAAPQVALAVAVAPTSERFRFDDITAATSASSAELCREAVALSKGTCHS